MTNAGLHLALRGKLAERPTPALAPYVDATAACLARKGLSRTSMTDIAKEMGVGRSTVYRQLGSVDHAAWLVAEQRAYMIYDQLPVIFSKHPGPRAVTEFVAMAIRSLHADPVLTKLLHDEPLFMGQILGGQISPLFDELTEQLAPFLSTTMHLGLIKTQDPIALGHMTLCVIVSLMLAPPPTDLDEMVNALLLPTLTPEPDPTNRPTAQP